MHINGQAKQIELTEAGHDVILTLDGQTAIIRHNTLEQLYLQLHNDIALHGEL